MRNDAGKDEGCRYSPSCLDCPLPLCRHDDPGGEIRQVRARRDRRVLQHLRRGASVLEVARQTGIGKRTLYRIQRGAA